MAVGIIEKSNNGLFENEIEMNGNYATIVRHLKDDLSTPFTLPTWAKPKQKYIM